MVIIIAAGEATRWGDYAGKNKHFLEVDGEALLHRTARIAKELWEEKIYVVAKTDDYQIEGTTLWEPIITPEFHDADKFLSSYPLWWDAEEEVIFLYGDVYFSHYCLMTVKNTRVDDYLFLGRFGRSYYTLCQWGELFAIKFAPAFIPNLLESLFVLVEERIQGRIDRNGGWELYRCLEGFPLDKHRRGEHFVEINDFSEDFDFPRDYEFWVAQKNSYDDFVRLCVRR